jgi:tetratricopeptide (TPR) repeat protein
MMIEQHYDEEVLAGFLAEPIDSEARDRHLSGCSLCKQTLKSIRDTAGLLKQPDVWNSESFSSAPRPQTLAFLRNVQRTMADEDAAAEVYVKQLLAGSRETWAPRLVNHPEWRTAGVVRELIAATDGYNFTSPLDAVELTRIGTQIAESLPACYGRDSLAADAWREHAYAQLIVGSYNEAMAAVDQADRFVSAASDFAGARTTLMRALVLRNQENWTDAGTMARRAAAEFLRFGDIAKYFSARMTDAFVLYDNSQYRKAAAVYAELSPLHAQIPPQTLALAWHNEGLCHREVGEFARAETCFVNAIALADRLQMALLRTKALWHLARVLMRQSRYDDALKVLNPLLGEFEELGVSHDLACASVDIAESLLALGRVGEVAGLCRRAIEFFRVSGLAYTTEAMTALAYLQEAALTGRLTVNDVAEVRVVVERYRKGSPAFSRSRSRSTLVDLSY